MNGDKLTRWTAYVAVGAVAAIAALISYRHAVGVVSAHGEPGMVGRLYPVLIDGLIIAASMVLLDAARYREPAPPLAWWMLAAGIVATVAVNVVAGVPSGWLGAIVAAWPAGAFVGCCELVTALVRASARRLMFTPPGALDAVSQDAAPAPTCVEEAAAMALRATIVAGNPLSGRQLEARFGLTRAQATKVRQLVSADEAA